MDESRKIIIIGSGPAGLTASLYAARAGLNPLLLTGTSIGGYLMTTTIVENFPGFPDGISGPELMQNMLKQAQKFGTEVKYEVVDKVDFSKKEKSIFVKDKEYKTRTVILAMGSNPRKLGLESEQKFWGKGVASCATCDGALYKDKVVAVIGGGDTAMEEADFLTKFASKVFVIQILDNLTASPIMQDRVKKNKKIEVMLNTEVKDIVGFERVEKLKLEDKKTGLTFELKVDGMFLAIGYVPNTTFLRDHIELDDRGYIKVKKQTQTSIDGIFTAGDIADDRYKQAIVAAGSGCKAAIDAQRWLEESAD